MKMTRCRYHRPRRRQRHRRGAPVANFTPVAASGFSLAHVKLSNAGDGSHSVAGDQGIGISVYGVIDYGSYWYPGGLDLDVIPQ